MAVVKVEVVPYPFAGVVGFQAQELTLFEGWVDVLDTVVVGVHPDYITSYALTVTSDSHKIRVRWEFLTDRFTAWFKPHVILTPTVQAIERLTEAVIAKATRILALRRAPLGYSGDLLDEMVTTVRSDRQIEELLYGLRFRDWDVDLTVLVTVQDVVRAGLQADSIPASQEPDVQRAIDSAVSWVAHYTLEGVGVA